MRVPDAPAFSVLLPGARRRRNGHHDMGYPLLLPWPTRRDKPITSFAHATTAFRILADAAKSMMKVGAITQGIPIDALALCSSMGPGARSCQAPLLSCSG